MVNSMMQKLTFGMAIALLAGGLVGCGGEDSTMSVDLFGWVDDEGDDGQFVIGLPEYDGADEIRIRVTEPAEQRVVNEETFEIEGGTASLPDIEGGGGRRIEFDVRAQTETVASGATPTFDVNEQGLQRSFRTMISDVDQFAPVGSIVQSSQSGERGVVESIFDLRQLDEIEASGRLGHTADATDSGQVLVVGGAQVGSSYEPMTVPSIDKSFADIQLFDPATGYFTELGGDDEALRSGLVGEDRLQVPRAFHTVTPVGDDRFVVAGGFDEAANPVDVIEIIDLQAEAGQRVTTLSSELVDARGHHSATYLETNESVVIAGGVADDDSDVLDSMEVIDPDGDGLAGLDMQSPRVGHSAVLLEDRETIWFIGGRSGDSSDVLASTEVLDVESGSTQPGPQLDRARYGASALHLGESSGNSVAIIGGFTAGGATAHYEIGNPLQGDELQARSGWEINEARGGMELFQLPHSGDLLAVGGYNGDREPLGSVERMEVSLSDLPPLNVDSTAGSMVRLRSAPATAALSSGRFFVVGGLDDGGQARDNAEYFNPDDPIAP